jgi:ketosteroid isomerase-like protein
MTEDAMATPRETIIDLENKFWQSMVDQDTNMALDMLTEPAVMVSAHGAMKFGHEEYRKMAEHGNLQVKSFELSNMEVVFPNATTAVATYHVKQQVAPRGKSGATEQEMNDTSTWVKTEDGWKCVMHTETPADGERKM